MTTDLSLIEQVTARDNRRAFDELVRRYQSPVRRFLLNLTLGNGQLSDDLAQDTFVKAYLNIGRFRGDSSFLTWLMRIAYNVFYDHVRKQQSRAGGDYLPVDHPSVQGVAAAGASLATPSSALKIDLYTALSILKSDERTCITLQLIDGYDITAIASITGMKEGTVKSHLSRGKEKMANFLRKNGYDRNR